VLAKLKTFRSWASMPARRSRGGCLAGRAAENGAGGLPEAAVKESTHRVERAIVNSGFQRRRTAWLSTSPACSVYHNGKRAFPGNRHNLQPVEVTARPDERRSGLLSATRGRTARFPTHHMWEPGSNKPASNTAMASSELRSNNQRKWRFE